MPAAAAHALPLPGAGLRRKADLCLKPGRFDGKGPTGAGAPHGHLTRLQQGGGRVWRQRPHLGPSTKPPQREPYHRLDRPYRHPEVRCDLRVAEAPKECEPQELALHGFELRKRSVHDPVTLGGFEEVRDALVGIELSADATGGGRCCAPFAPRVQCAAAAYHQKPRLDGPARGVVFRGIDPSLEVDVGNHLLGEAMIAHDSQGDPENLADGRIVKLRERGLVARRDALQAAEKLRLEREKRR